MPILVGPQHMAGLVTWTVATGVARPHSGISKLKVPTDETGTEFVDLHMLEPFAHELETLPLDTLVFQEPGEDLVFYIPLYFEQRMNESLVQRIDTRFRVCKDSRDLVKKFLTALAKWADRKPDGPAANFLARILCHPLLRRLREPDECSRIISPIIGCGTNRRVRQSVAETEAFKTKMARINSSLNQVGFAAEYRPGNEKDKGLRVRRITPVTPSIQPPPMAGAGMMVQPEPAQQVLTTAYVGQRRSGSNSQNTKPVTVRALKPGAPLLTADLGGLQPANPQQITPLNDPALTAADNSNQMAPVSQSHPPARSDEQAPATLAAHLPQAQSLEPQHQHPLQAPMMHSMGTSMAQQGQETHLTGHHDQGAHPSAQHGSRMSLSNSGAAMAVPAPQQAITSTMALVPPISHAPHDQPPVSMAMSMADPTMFSTEPMPPRARNLPRQGGKRRNRAQDSASSTATSVGGNIPPADEVLGHPGAMVSNHSGFSYQMPPDQAQQFLQQMHLSGTDLDDGACLNPLLKLLSEAISVLTGFAAQGSPVKPFVEFFILMQDELSKPILPDMRINLLNSLNRQCSIFLSKTLIESCIEAEDQRDYFARVVPSLLNMLATAENELMVAAFVQTTSKDVQSSTADGAPSHKRAHHEAPLASIPPEQLATLIRQQLLPRLLVDPHGSLSPFNTLYQQLQMMRDAGMPASTMATGVLTTLADFLSPEPAPPTA
eukprot:m.173484 g.173484  ORF g.173484 m.173484 type:complete len:719 (-) comp16738_c0_seq1:2037-4193(-)